MKTLSIIFKSVVILLLAGWSMIVVSAQTEKKEIVTKVYEINPSGSLQIISSRSNIKILTWDKNEVKVVGELTYEGIENQEDIDKILNAFKNMNVESSKDLLMINLSLIPVKIALTNKNSLFFNRDKSSSIIPNYIIPTYTIWIPETLSVIVDSKYEKLEMASIKGNVNFTMDNSKLEMGDFGESGIFEIKYSNVSIGNGGASKFNLFNSIVNAAELKSMTIDSKYSKFNISKTDDVSLKSFNDTFVFGILNEIDASANYSTVRMESHVEKSKFEFFNSKLYGKNFKTMEISAKFSEFHITDAGKSSFVFQNSKLFGGNFQSMEISSARFSEFSVADVVGETKINLSNNSKFNFATVNTFSCQQSRFDTFKFDEIITDVSFPDANNTKVDIHGTSASFSGFSGNFTFGNVNMKINPNIEYNLYYDGTYGRINVSSDKFKKRFVYNEYPSKTDIKGLNTDAKCNVEIVAHSTTCTIE